MAEKSTKPEIKSVEAITTSVLNLRKGPSKKCEVLQILNKETTVTVLSENGEWSKVAVDGTTGYCMTEFLSK